MLLGGTFTWVAYKVSKWSTFDAMYWGAYLGGAASAVLASAVIILGRRMLFLHPEQVFRGVLRVARDSPITQHHLGRDVTPGTFRAYAHTGGFFFDRTKPVLGFIPRPSYRKQGLQILFQLQGKDAGQQGLVSCEVSRHIGRGPLEITSLSLDLQNGERLVWGNSTTEHQHASVVESNATNNLSPPTPKSHVLVGSHEDVVYKGVIRLR